MLGNGEWGSVFFLTAIFFSRSCCLLAYEPAMSRSLEVWRSRSG